MKLVVLRDDGMLTPDMMKCLKINLFIVWSTTLKKNDSVWSPERTTKMAVAGSVSSLLGT